MENNTPFESSPSPVHGKGSKVKAEALEIQRSAELPVTPEGSIERGRRKAAFAFQLTAMRSEKSTGGSSGQLGNSGLPRHPANPSNLESRSRSSYH